ncbi:MAG: class I SAM-dependent methyltransferase [bacterium]
MTRWQDFYDVDLRVLTAPPSDFVKFAAEWFTSVGAKTILDLGCGIGRDTCLLAASEFEVVGCDMAMSGLTHAQRIANEKHLPIVFQQADARDLPFSDAQFDAVYCFGMLHEFTGENYQADIRTIMSEIQRVLAPQGLLALAMLSGDPQAGLPHVRLFTAEDLDKAVHGFTPLFQREHNDIGCTGIRPYRMWQGIYQRDIRAFSPSIELNLIQTPVSPGESGENIRTTGQKFHEKYARAMQRLAGGVEK